VKILLREHVENLGERGQTVAVAAGYARNYLLPKGLAVPATPGNLKVLAQQRRMWEIRETKEVQAAQAVAARLAAIQLQVKRKAGRGGTLYGSVTSTEIAELLGRAGVQVDRRRLVLPEAIKSVGLHEISIKLHREVVGRVQLDVQGEGLPLAEADVDLAADADRDEPDRRGRDD
jgi:large subunit ribosomal protein L9